MLTFLCVLRVIRTVNNHYFPLQCSRILFVTEACLVLWDLRFETLGRLFGLNWKNWIPHHLKFFIGCMRFQTITTFNAFTMHSHYVDLLRNLWHRITFGFLLSSVPCTSESISHVSFTLFHSFTQNWFLILVRIFKEELQYTRARTHAHFWYTLCYTADVTSCATRNVNRHDSSTANSTVTFTDVSWA